jgi:tRNA(Arg) A34 adenosine deaminase TadA
MLTGENMHPKHLALLEQAPPGNGSDDLWARLCCEQALLALEEGSYAVGALLVNQTGELLLSGRNRVFSSHYGSARHAEMQVIDELETLHPDQDRHTLTLYVSLQPCLMCFARILLSGIPRVRYLAHDRNGGFSGRYTQLPRHGPICLRGSILTGPKSIPTGANWPSMRSTACRILPPCATVSCGPGPENATRKLSQGIDACPLREATRELLVLPGPATD